MVKDHTKTSKEPKGLVGKAKVKVPNSLDPDDQAKIAKLQALKGEEFSAAYAGMQVEAHQEAVNLFEAYSGRRR
jgi:putative membrane protein